MLPVVIRIVINIYLDKATLIYHNICKICISDSCYVYDICELIREAIKLLLLTFVYMMLRLVYWFREFNVRVSEQGLA